MGETRPCTVDLPRPEELRYAARKLQELYPEDMIEIHAPHHLASAVKSAVYAFMFSREECRRRSLRAIATLSFELVKLHPLTDGNKRLSTLVLVAALHVNNLPLPPPGLAYRFALASAGERVGLEEALELLERLIDKS